MDLKELERIRVFVSNKFGTRNYQEKPVVTPFDVVDWIREWQENLVTDEDLASVSGSIPLDPVVLAKWLHDKYEEVAKRAKWNTREDCKVEFDNLPVENQNTMILLAGEFIKEFGAIDR